MCFYIDYCTGLITLFSHKLRTISSFFKATSENLRCSNTFQSKAHQALQAEDSMQHGLQSTLLDWLEACR